MKKKLIALWLVVVLLVAASGLSCQQQANPGRISVQATLCGEGWYGEVQYRLTRAGDPTGADTIVGSADTSVGGSHVATIGTWTLEYISGGPPGAYLVDITDAPTQYVPESTQLVGFGFWSVTPFTMNFEIDPDASIDFLTWTINGDPVEPNTPESPYTVTCGDIIDVHFQQHVAGCGEEEVRVTEYNSFDFYHTAGYIDLVRFHVLDDWDAIAKAPVPVEKESQALFFNEELVEHCQWFEMYDVEPSPDPMPMTAETVWLLEKCTEYEKAINLFRLGECLDPSDPTPVLFEVFIDALEPVYATLIVGAEVEIDDEDVDPENNSAESPPLYIVFVPEVDASIEFLDWTINGDPLVPHGSNGEVWYEAEVTWGEIVDVHFGQYVDGCKQVVDVIEYSLMEIHLVDGPIPFAGLHVMNEPCALHKAPPPVEELYRYLYVDGAPVEYCMLLELEQCTPRILEAETYWVLQKQVPYVKSINWLRIGETIEPGCVLFELLFDTPGVYHFVLVASAEVELPLHDDADPANNIATSPPLYLTVNVNGGP